MVQTKARAVGRVWSRDYQIFQDGAPLLIYSFAFHSCFEAEYRHNSAMAY